MATVESGKEPVHPLSGDLAIHSRSARGYLAGEPLVNENSAGQLNAWSPALQAFVVSEVPMGPLYANIIRGDLPKAIPGRGVFLLRVLFLVSIESKELSSGTG